MVDKVLIERGKKYAKKQGIDFDSLNSMDQKLLIVEMLRESLKSDDKPKNESVNVKAKEKSFWGKVSDTISTLSESNGDDSSITKTCDGCYSQSPGNSNFCNNCGKKLGY